jgi:hypothetical protein
MRALVLFGLLVSVCADAPVLTGPYSVEHTTLKVPGLQISSDLVDVYYATNSTLPQRFIAFGHGASGGSVIQPFVYKSILTALASWGFVIGACRSCIEGTCDGDYYKQQLILIDWAKKVGAGGDKIMSLVNFTGGVGISGHSMGGGSTLMDSSAEQSAPHNIRAAVMLHAYTDSQVKKSVPVIPFLAFTGTSDTTAPSSMTKAFYAAASSSTPRGIVNKVGASHQEPSDYHDKTEPYNPLMAQYTAAWFKIYLDDYTGGGPVDFHDMIFGSGPTSICGGGDGSMETCKMVPGN